MHDFKKIIPGIKIKGVDISEYAINNCINTVKNDVMVADARNLPFESNSFDLVISITTIHQLVLLLQLQGHNALTYFQYPFLVLPLSSDILSRHLACEDRQYHLQNADK